MIKLGCHVGMSGKEMFLGSVKEAVSYGANTFMIYTGAPQNTRRKEICELNMEAGHAYMKEHDIDTFFVHAPYIINLANTIKPEIYELAVEFLAKEIDRTAAMGSHVLILHPGAHVGAGVVEGTKQIIKGLNEVLTANTPVLIALETMAGKGTEIGRNFEEIAAIYDGVIHNEKLRVCFDTCHVNDSGYNLVHQLSNVFEEFDRVIGKKQIAVFHLNDSKNPMGARKDRHENIGFGSLGFSTIEKILYDPDFLEVPKILETPYIKIGDTKKSLPPYKEEIAMLRAREFDVNIYKKEF